MNAPARLRMLALAGVLAAGLPGLGWTQDAALVERAKASLAGGQAGEAYSALAAAQAEGAGKPEFDYLLGVAALDSGHLEDAIIAFERVLAVMPNHAGAQMDLARAYYAAGSFDLAEAAFVKLRAANPPPAAREAIARYLEAIRQRKLETQAGWSSFGELGVGYDSNITGVPANFGAAAEQSFRLTGIEPTGNAIKRSAPYLQGTIGTDYYRPASRGWTVFAGGTAGARVYHDEPDFNAYTGDVHAGAALNQGADQWRMGGAYFGYWQQGEAPGAPQPTNDRRMASLAGDWRHALDTRTQLGLSLQLNAIRFPRNAIEDFDQVYVSASWLKSFERAGVPLLFLSAFATDDRAKNPFAGADPGTLTSKSKNLFGARGFLQYSITPSTQAFGGLALIHRRDRDAFARSTAVERGRDTYGEASLGAVWQFREKCALRLQYLYSRNNSNIDIYDYDRHEISSTIRCALD